MRCRSLFLDARKYDPRKGDHGGPRTGTPSRSPVGTASHGHRVRGDREPEKVLPGPGLASRRTQLGHRQVFTWCSHALPPHPERAPKIGNWLLKKRTSGTVNE